MEKIIFGFLGSLLLVVIFGIVQYVTYKFGGGNMAKPTLVKQASLISKYKIAISLVLATMVISIFAFGFDILYAFVIPLACATLSQLWFKFILKNKFDNSYLMALKLIAILLILQLVSILLSPGQGEALFELITLCTLLFVAYDFEKPLMAIIVIIYMVASFSTQMFNISSTNFAEIDMTSTFNQSFLVGVILVSLIKISTIFFMTKYIISQKVISS